MSGACANRTSLDDSVESSVGDPLKVIEASDEGANEWTTKSSLKPMRRLSKSRLSTQQTETHSKLFEPEANDTVVVKMAKLKLLEEEFKIIGTYVLFSDF
jgi:hypothetical protein